MFPTEGGMIPVHVRLAELIFRKGVHAGVRRLYPLSSSFTQILDSWAASGIITAPLIILMDSNFKAQYFPLFEFSLLGWTVPFPFTPWHSIMIFLNMHEELCQNREISGIGVTPHEMLRLQTQLYNTVTLYLSPLI